MPHIGDKVREVSQSLGPCLVPASTLEPTAYLGDLPPPFFSSLGVSLLAFLPGPAYLTGPVLCREDGGSTCTVGVQ